MNRKVNFFVWSMVVLALILMPTVSFAEDYITEAVRELQNSGLRVYVHPNAEYTNVDTSSRLDSYLRPDDNIVLVMLPAEAMTGTDPESLARQLSEKLGDGRIIGLAVGKEVVGYAPVLPGGVADDQMRRAESVSNDPVTALGTFVQDMHLWLDKHPQPTSTPTPQPTSTPTPKVGSGDMSDPNLWIFQILVISAPTLAALGALIAIRSRRTKKQYGNISAKLKRQVDQDLADSKEALSAIRELIYEVRDPHTRSILEEAYSIASGEIVEEIEAEPQRATPTTILQIKKDLETFSAILKPYTQILSGYLNENALPEGFMKSLENEFFPHVRNAFQEIAIELDRGDLKVLENLVSELSAQFKSQGLE